MDVLHRGVVDATGGKRERASAGRNFNADALSTAGGRKLETGYELVLYSKVGIGDGRYANVPWIQELPDPVTKIVWDNYLSVSPKTAANEKLRQGDIVELTVGSDDAKKTVEVPVAIQPGLHDSVLGLAIGYGREGAGKVASDLGVNAALLTTWTDIEGKDGSARITFAGMPATFKKTGASYKLVSTQGHHELRDAKWEAKGPHDRGRNHARGLAKRSRERH